MNPTHQLFQPEWRPLAADIARSSCINEDVAELLMCQSLGVASGNSVQVRTPEFRDIGLSFNLALVSSGFPMPRGALMQFLGPIPELVRLANDLMKDAGMGIEALKVSLGQLREELREVEETLPKEESALVHSKTPAGEMARGMSSNYGAGPSHYTPNAIEARINAVKQRRDKILCAIDTLIFKLRSGILVDEPNWRELPKLGDGSLDETVMAMSFAKGPADIFNLSAKDRTACAETLNGNRIEARAVTAITCGPESVYADVLSQKTIRESDLLAGFLFIDVGNESEDPPSVLRETDALSKWHNLIGKCWERRIEFQNRRCDLYRPDARGFTAYVEFRKWVEREQGYSPDISSYLSMLPDLCLRLAMARASISNAAGDLIIPHEYVEHAADFLRRIGRRHREILVRLTAGQPEVELIEQQIGRLVAKLERRGPLTMRGLARSMHNQDYGHLEPILKQGLKRGNIIQAGNLFRVPSVSVSPSAAAQK